MANHDEIAAEAYRIWQKRKSAGDKNADDEKENWKRAVETLEKKELEHTWKLKFPLRWFKK